MDRGVQMVGTELNRARAKRRKKKKKESRGDMSSQFVFGSFSLSIFLPALYYLNAWNKLLVDYSNIKKMQPLLN